MSLWLGLFPPGIDRSRRTVDTCMDMKPCSRLSTISLASHWPLKNLGALEENVFLVSSPTSSLLGRDVGRLGVTSGVRAPSPSPSPSTPPRRAAKLEANDRGSPAVFVAPPPFPLLCALPPGRRFMRNMLVVLVLEAQPPAAAAAADPPVVLDFLPPPLADDDVVGSIFSSSVLLVRPALPAAVPLELPAVGAAIACKPRSMRRAVKLPTPSSAHASFSVVTGRGYRSRDFMARFNPCLSRIQKIKTTTPVG